MQAAVIQKCHCSAQTRLMATLCISEWILFFFCLRNIVRIEIISAKQKYYLFERAELQCKFWRVFIWTVPVLFPRFSAFLLSFFKTNFSILSGIPHADMECNDTVILGFMMAQFIADFHYQVPRAKMLPLARRPKIRPHN
jgi:hypothetical protein